MGNAIRLDPVTICPPPSLRGPVRDKKRGTGYMSHSEGVEVDQDNQTDLLILVQNLIAEASNIERLLELLE